MMARSNPQSSNLFQKLQDPYPTLLPYFDRINKQLQLLSDNAGDDSLGTVSSAKHNQKPFIIGFIAPDVPVNFVPIEKKQTKIQNIPATATIGPEDSVFIRGAVPKGTPGLQPKTNTPINGAQLRQALYNSYVKLTNQAPTEATLSLIYAQTLLESGGNNNRINIYNYNFGNVHAGGGRSDFPDNNPKLAPINTPKTPGGGSYFLTYDSDPVAGGGNKYYSCYMKNYDNLDDGAGGQIAILLQNWPGTGTAQTPEDFNRALLPGPGKNYYTASPDTYLKNLRARQSAYYASFPDPLSGTAPITSQDQVAVGSVMSNGAITDPDGDDPLSFTGRNIQISDKRAQIASSQTNAIQQQIDFFRTMPPLIMIINPSDFERNYEQSVDSSPKGRQGHIIHQWLEKPMEISAKGVTSGQYVIAADGSGGLNTTNRVYSISYQNLMSLAMIYKNNGVIFSGQESGSGNKGIPILQMSIYIYFDNHLYIGSFDTFEISDSGDKPHNMEYSWKFTVYYSVDMNQITDNVIVNQLGF